MEGNGREEGTSVFTASDLLNGEFNRRKEFKFGRGFRAKLRTWKGQILPYSFKAARERQDRHISTEKLLMHIHSNNESIILSRQNWMKNIAEIVAKKSNGIEIPQKSSSLVTLKERLEMRSFVELQQSIQLLFPTKRSMATSVIHLKNVNKLDVMNSLIEFPKWIGYQYHFLRVVSKMPLKLVWREDSGLLVNEENGKTRNLRVRPTTYNQKLEKSMKTTAKSISCESGFSTISLISTATTSPNSWCNDWKWQPRHAEYDHRLSTMGIYNLKTMHEQGQDEFFTRFNEEVADRLRTCAADMEQVQDYLFLNNRFDPIIGALCEREEEHSAQTPMIDMTQIGLLEKHLQKLIGSSQLTVDEKKDLQVLFYAKERYEPLLSGCKNICSEDNELGSSLAINDSWCCVLKTKRIEQADTLDTLKLIVRDSDVWNLGSDFSNKTLVERCDRQKRASPIDASGFKDFNQLSDAQMTYVTMAVVVVYVLLVCVTVMTLLL